MNAIVSQRHVITVYSRPDCHLCADAMRMLRALRDELGIAAEVALGAFQHRPVAREVALGLTDLRIKRASPASAATARSRKSTGSSHVTSASPM